LFFFGAFPLPLFSGIFAATLLASEQRNSNSLASNFSSMMTVESVLKGKYPAKAHARRVVEYIKKLKPDVQGLLYLEGQKTRMIEDNDEPQPFR
jgi:hypothetical protein